MQQKVFSSIKDVSELFSSKASLSKARPEPTQKNLLDDVGNPRRFSPLLRQLLVASGPTLLTVCCGMISGFSAILLPQLNSTDTAIPVTDAEGSWVASMAALPMALGCVLGGVIMERLGRKWAHLVPCLPCSAGWALIYAAGGLRTLLWGRFLTGLASGMLAPPCGVYVGETSSPKYRGLLLAVISLAMSAGLLAAHLLGTYFTWRTVALACVAQPCLAAGLLAVVPESPSWLARRGRTREAVEAFLWCRGRSIETKGEVDAMLERQRDSEGGSDLRRPEFLKPLAIINAYLLITQFCGVNAISFYTVRIMKDTMGDTFDEYTATLIVDATRVASSLLACVLLRRVGRRPLTVVSGVGTSVSLLALSALVCTSAAPPPFLPLAAVVGYVGFVTLGLVPLPWVLMGEVFPFDLRGLGSGISSTVTLVAIFVVVKTTPGVFAAAGPAGAFAGFGAVACLGTWFLYVFLPETKDRTLHEIEESFKGKVERVEMEVL